MPEAFAQLLEDRVFATVRTCKRHVPAFAGDDDGTASQLSEACDAETASRPEHRHRRTGKRSPLPDLEQVLRRERRQRGCGRLEVIDEPGFQAESAAHFRSI